MDFPIRSIKEMDKEISYENILCWKNNTNQMESVREGGEGNIKHKQNKEKAKKKNVLK